MSIRIYLRASTKNQDATRALDSLKQFAETLNCGETIIYPENYSGTKLERPVLNQLLNESEKGDILLVESIDRLSRLTQENFEILKQRIKAKGIRLIVLDLPTTHIQFNDTNEITTSILVFINNMLIDLLATMARLDNEQRKKRIRDGQLKAGYRPNGKKPNLEKHQRILELHEKGLKIADIKTLVKCGEATIYRVLKNKNTI